MNYGCYCRLYLLNLGRLSLWECVDIFQFHCLLGQFEHCRDSFWAVYVRFVIRICGGFIQRIGCDFCVFFGRFVLRWCQLICHFCRWRLDITVCVIWCSWRCSTISVTRARLGWWVNCLCVLFPINIVPFGLLFVIALLFTLRIL